MALNSFRKRCSNVYPLLYASFVIKMEILPIIMFLLHMKHITADFKTLEQRFLKEFMTTCRKSSESELQQQSDLKFDISRLCPEPFKCVCWWNWNGVK